MQLKNSYYFWKQCVHSRNTLESYISEVENRHQNFTSQHAQRNSLNIIEQPLIKSEEPEDFINTEQNNVMDYENLNIDNVPNPVNENIQRYFNSYMGNNIKSEDSCKKGLYFTD